MHELGITQGIIDRARAAALSNNAVRVTAVYVAMTPAADFTEESISMYYSMMTGEDELLRDAELRFEHQPAEARCLECGVAFTATLGIERCPQCGSVAISFDPNAPMIQLVGVDIDEGEG